MSSSISITGSTPLSTTQREPEALLELASSPGWAGDVSAEQRAAVTPLSGASTNRSLNSSSCISNNVPEALDIAAVAALDSSVAGAAGLAHPLGGGGSHAFREGDESSLRFFLPVLVSDKTERRQAIELIEKHLTAPENVELLKSHIARLVRMRGSCPLRDLTAACDRIITHARSVLPHVPEARPLSRFFEQDAMLSPFTERDGGDVRALYRTQFLQFGRLSYLARVLSFRSDYAEAFFTCQRDIMSEPGPLPIVWRHYIALLAAARHRSAYLCELQSELFVLSGGDAAWLDGIANSPTKMQSYAALDAVTAHQPWLLSAALFSPLLRGADAWTVGELVHAVVISATFRALAGIVAGCGLNFEVDFVNVSGDARTDEYCAPPEPAVPVVDAAAAKATELVIKRLQLVELTESGLDEGDDDAELAHGAAAVEQFNRAGEEDDAMSRRSSSSANSKLAAVAPPPAAPAMAPAPAAAAAAGAAARSGPNSASQPAAVADGLTRLQLNEIAERTTAYLSKFIGPHTLRHDDFDVHSRQYHIFRANDYSWPHQGYELLLRFLPRVAQPLDNLFNLTQTMTDNCFSTFDNVDTGPYRRAVWQYVQRTKGVLHDDYDYQDINVYLNKFNKNFIKKIVCYPEHVTAHDFQQLGYVMAPHEKLHLCALAVESRKQAELLYALRALMTAMGLK